MGASWESDNGLLSYHVIWIAHHRLGITYQAIKLDVQSSKPTSVGSDSYVTEMEQVVNEVTQMPGTTSTSLLSPSTASWGMLCDWMTTENQSKAWFINSATLCRVHPPEVDS